MEHITSQCIQLKSISNQSPSHLKAPHSPSGRTPAFPADLLGFIPASQFSTSSQQRAVNPQWRPNTNLSANCPDSHFPSVTLHSWTTQPCSEHTVTQDGRRAARKQMLLLETSGVPRAGGSISTFLDEAVVTTGHEEDERLRHWRRRDRSVDTDQPPAAGPHRTGSWALNPEINWQVISSSSCRPAGWKQPSSGPDHRSGG
ncbi:unnamed protein product [Pleuronectes platessa]|uniref:Uncharacterized protein n=1 Tax=Pleuronectes platessa TaxID=8262 RepID=A0A9N7U8R7_PLEPL|nr:unnamed protein product [Pleuronectes platessa]